MIFTADRPRHTREFPGKRGRAGAYGRQKCARRQWAAGRQAASRAALNVQLRKLVGADAFPRAAAWTVAASAALREDVQKGRSPGRTRLLGCCRSCTCALWRRDTWHAELHNQGRGHRGADGRGRGRHLCRAHECGGGGEWGGPLHICCCPLRLSHFLRQHGRVSGAIFIHLRWSCFGARAHRERAPLRRVFASSYLPGGPKRTVWRPAPPRAALHAFPSSQPV